MATSRGLPQLAGRTALMGRPICRNCMKAWVVGGFANIQRRNHQISPKWLAKENAAAEQWSMRADMIKNGQLQGTWEMFEERGYVKDTAGTRETIRELMRTRRIGAYVGIDPTASSLHVGHLLPLMPLFWMYMNGYAAYSLIGGSTAKIGDPTGRLTTRENIAKADLTMNMTKIHVQLKRLWINVDEQARRFGFEWEWAWRRGIVNNQTWWNKQPLLEVLRRVGQGVRIGPMLSRDTVKNKMTQGDGVSFAEFCYPIMQGWDWWKMFSKPRDRVHMQIGGSDQYGNIISGIEVVKTARASETDPAERLPAESELDDPVGFTVPLLTDASGVKFGKTAGNAVWLDQYQTSVFDFYGYFVRRPDTEIERLLKLFTFLPMSDIQKAMEEHALDPPKRVPHHLLAYEVTWLVHGKALATEAQEQHRQMYGKGTISLPTRTSGDEYKAVEGHPTTPNNAPRPDMILPESLIMGKSIGRILFAAGLASSASDGHRLAANSGVHIGGMPGQRNRPMDPGQLTFTTVKLWFPQETKNYLIDGKILILRKGRHNLRIIEMVSDEEYAKSGQTYPGQPYTGALRKLYGKVKAVKSGGGSARALREQLATETWEEDDELAPGGEAKLQFPEEKGRPQKKMEAKIERLAEEESKKE